MSTFRKFPKFSGRFFSWRCNLTSDHNSGLQEDFLVFSSGKRDTALNSLWLKFLWDQLSSEEFILFILTLRDSEEMKIAFIKASFKINKKELRERLIRIQSKLNIQVDSRARYNGSKSQRIEIQKIERKLPKPKKFSGYVRNISSLGTKSRKTRFLETIAYGGVFGEEEFDWYLALLQDIPSIKGP